MWLYILSFTEIHSGVLEPQGRVENWPSLLVWLVAYMTACTKILAVTQSVSAAFSQPASRPKLILLELAKC